MPAAETDYSTDGYLYLPDLFDTSLAGRLAEALEAISGLPADDCGPVLDGTREPYYQHGGVAAHPPMWPLLTHPGLVKAVGAALQSAPRCLPGIDTIGMHIAETEAHRDASPDELPTLGDNPYDREYNVVRVITYPSSPGERFGLLPGSHRRPGSCSDLVAADPDAWRWITLRGGDALLFDPRLVHAGAAITAPKPMAVVTYGVDGEHALQTYFHGRIKTASLGFTDPAHELHELLDRERLMLDGTQDQANWRRFSALWAE